MTQQAQRAMSPADALKRLTEGNDRFVRGHPLKRDFPTQAQETASGQYPFAAVLCCVDSRVSPELVFDQGLGDVFCVRIAGNIVNDDILGSLEFATQVAGARLVLILGHSACGAIKGACNKVELGHLTGLLDKIEPAVDAVKAKPGTEVHEKSADFVDLVARENVRRMVRLLQEESPILKDLVGRGALRIVGGFQDLPTGRVVLLD
jgi:carbonic anhydrase